MPKSALLHLAEIKGDIHSKIPENTDKEDSWKAQRSFIAPTCTSTTNRVGFGTVNAATGSGNGADRITALDIIAGTCMSGAHPGSPGRSRDRFVYRCGTIAPVVIRAAPDARRTQQHGGIQQTQHEYPAMRRPPVSGPHERGAA